MWIGSYEQSLSMRTMRSPPTRGRPSRSATPVLYLRSRFMSDLDLREKERAAREAPHDRVAGWELVRALERAGDRRESFRVIARLARLGDREAIARLHRLPWPCASGLGQA